MRLLKISIHTLYILCILSLYALSQSSSSISGRLSDAKTGGNIAYANIILYRSGDSTAINGSASGEEGKFAFPGLAYGSYDISIRMIGYQKKDLRNIVINSTNRTIDLGKIFLEQKLLQTSENVVVGEKSELQLSLDKKTFNIGSDLSNSGSSAAEVLDNIPSVTVDVEGNVSLRGSGSVRVLVDGKPSALLGISGTEALRNLPADILDRVEVITNPSARYDAEGSAGIINLVLRKDRQRGLNGSFNLPIGFPTNHGAAVSLNYRQNNLNFFVGNSTRYRKRPGEGYLYQETYDESTSYLEEQSNRERGGWSNTSRLGAEYFFDDKTTLTGSLVYSYSDENNLAQILYLDSDAQRNLTSSSFRQDDEAETEKELEYELNFNKEFGKNHKLTIDVQYEGESELEVSDIFEEPRSISLAAADADTLNQYVSNLQEQTEILLQMDYTRPFKKGGHFEFGLKTDIRDLTNIYRVEQQDDLGNWTNLTNYTNNFDYAENVSAAYVIVGYKFDRFSYQGGVRGEFSDIITHLLVTDEKNDRNYLGLFPSGHITYEIFDHNSLQMSYSRRLRRPRHRELNPFSSYTDARNIRRGNPNLDPEYTNAYEIGYLRHSPKASWGSSIYFRDTKGEIEYIRTLEDTLVIRQPENLSQRRDYGLEVNGSVVMAQWWDLDANANFYRSISDGSTISEDFRSDTYSWYARMSSKMELWDFDTQLRFNYHGPREGVQSKRKASHHVDLSISKDILDGNGTLTLSVRDLFNTRSWEDEVFADDFYSLTDNRWRQRSIRFGFNYRLNQKKRAVRDDNDNGGDLDED